MNSPKNKSTMKNCLLFTLTLFIHLSSYAQDEVEDVKSTIVDYYWNVMYTNEDRKEISAIADGFHEKFNMYVYYKGELSVRTRDGWMDILQRNRDKARVNPSNKPKKKNRLEFGFVDVTGQTAVAKLLIYSNDEIKYTDYLSLYKIDGEWKIITKLFTFHQI